MATVFSALNLSIVTKLLCRTVDGGMRFVSAGKKFSQTMTQQVLACHAMFDRVYCANFRLMLRYHRQRIPPENY